MWTEDDRFAFKGSRKWLASTLKTIGLAYIESFVGKYGATLLHPAPIHAMRLAQRSAYEC